MTAEEEEALGESVGHRLKSNYGVTDDEALHRYVNLVGLTVAHRMDADDRRFIVLDAEFINAFSVPGQDIYVTGEPIDTTDSEALTGLSSIHVRPGAPSGYAADVFFLLGEPEGKLCAVNIEAGS